MNYYFIRGCILALVTIIVYWLFWRWSRRRTLRLATQLPGPPALPILGNALTFMTNPEEQLKIIAGLIKRYGDYVRFWLGPDLIICVKDPKDIRILLPFMNLMLRSIDKKKFFILGENPDQINLQTTQRQLLTSNKMNQKGPAYAYMTPFIGKGILTGGPKWRTYRKISNPSYSKKSIEIFEKVFNQEAEKLANILYNKESEIFNVYFDVLQCTTQSVCRTLMGLSERDILEIRHLEEVILETQNMYSLMFSKMTKWWLQIPIIFCLTGQYKRQRYYLKIVNEMTSDIIEKRRRSLTKEHDIVAMGVVDRFIFSGLSENEIKLQTFALFTTSQEASAKIASGVLVFLAHLPEWQAKVYDEIVQVIGDNDENVSEEQIKKLQYLDMIYKEVLRYLSIAALIQRTVEEDITINNGKITLPAGTIVVIPIHEVHRDSRFWDEPLKVKPERFLPDNNKKRDPNAFIPFSLGAMDCLGRVYATTLIKTIIIRVLRRVELAAEGELEDLDLHVAISVKFAQGYNLRVRPRQK